MIINSINVILQGEISEDELSEYLGQLQAKTKAKIVHATVTVGEEYVDVQYKTKSVPFERIRRITGYLVGTTDRFCDAKRAEEHDRVKHG